MYLHIHCMSVIFFCIIPTYSTCYCHLCVHIRRHNLHPTDNHLQYDEHVFLCSDKLVHNDLFFHVSALFSIGTTFAFFMLISTIATTVKDMISALLSPIVIFDNTLFTLSRSTYIHCGVLVSMSLADMLSAMFLISARLFL